MTRILITEAAFVAIAGCKPDASQIVQDGSGRYGSAPEGQVAVWLPPPVLEALRAAREQAETYSDVILRLAEPEKAA